MRVGVGDLIAHSRHEGESAPILQFRVELTFEAQQYVSFTAQ